GLRGVPETIDDAIVGRPARLVACREHVEPALEHHDLARVSRSAAPEETRPRARELVPGDRAEHVAAAEPPQRRTGDQSRPELRQAIEQVVSRVECCCREQLLVDPHPAPLAVSPELDLDDRAPWRRIQEPVQAYRPGARAEARVDPAERAVQSAAGCPRVTEPRRQSPSAARTIEQHEAERTTHPRGGPPEMS